MNYEQLKDIELLFEWQEESFYTARHGADVVVLEMGEFPAEDLWSIYINRRFIENVNDLPPNWTVVKWETSEE